MPEISVILPTYNPDIPKLERAIESVLCQTYCDFELIVVDDGSEHEKQNEIRKLAATDERIRLIQQEHKGVSAARNNGIANAKGAYIAFVDDDDLVSPFYLEESRKVIIETDCNFILGGVIRQKGDTFPQGVIEKKDYAIEILEDESVREFEYNEILGHVKRLSDRGYVNKGPAAKLIRKDSCNIHFPENIVHGEDQICNLDILNQVKRIAIVDKIMVSVYYKQRISYTKMFF